LFLSFCIKPNTVEEKGEIMQKLNEIEKLHLMEPITINNMKLKNRIVMAPMVTNYGTEKGFVSKRIKKYYEARAKGGVGLIIIEATSVDFNRSKCWANQISIDNDIFIPLMKELVESIHNHECKVALQIHHGGSVARTDLQPMKPVSSSKIAYKDAYLKYSDKGVEPEELTTNDINNVIDLFSQAALRAKKSNFDAVEIHAAHGYLIGQFLSAARNFRKDKYGGELYNRARFLIKIIERIRDTVGNDFPVWCRLSAEETGFEGGITFEETIKIVKILNDFNIDGIHVSGVPPVRTYYSPAGYFLMFAAEIKKISRFPVFASGGINIDISEKVLKENGADLIVFGRALIADPEMAIKISNQKIKDIRPCLRCSLCRDCINYFDAPVKCSVNAEAGMEQEIYIKKTKDVKKVIIIGGGPAGMESARICALKGHNVSLYEKKSEIGGQLCFAAFEPNKELIIDFKNYLESELMKLKVKIKVNKNVNEALLRKNDFDVAIVATGSTANTLEIPGREKNAVMTVEEAFKAKKLPGAKIVIIGGGITGCELAYYFTESYMKVTIVEKLKILMENLNPSTIREVLITVLETRDVTVLTETIPIEIKKNGIEVQHKNGEKIFLDANLIVIAVGRTPNIKLFKKMKDIIPNIHLIGDAVNPGQITEAVETGFSIGLKI
jgi:2,4-dienoyl-CoA reductase-like NADH-dependent reductase (Old Yellow Enzyme family)/thioredoxin reductase